MILIDVNGVLLTLEAFGKLVNLTRSALGYRLKKLTVHPEKGYFLRVKPEEYPDLLASKPSNKQAVADDLARLEQHIKHVNQRYSELFEHINTK